MLMTGLYIACIQMLCRHIQWSRAVNPKWHDFQGKEILVTHSLINYPPAIVYYKRTKTVTGSDFEVVKYMSQILNFRYRLIPSIDGKYGSKLPNGSFNGMIGMASRHEVDISIGGIGFRTDRSKVVDFSWPLQPAAPDGTLVSHIPSKLPKWQALAWPFETRLWQGIGGALLIFGTIMKIMTALHEKIQFDDRKPYKTSVYLQIWRMVLNQSFQRWPHGLAMHLAFFVWIIFSFIITASYSGSLKGALVFPAKAKPLDTYKQLAENEDYVISAFSGSTASTFFNTYNDPSFKKLAKRKLIDVGYRQYEKVIENKNLVFLIPDVSADLSLNFALMTGESYLHVGKETKTQISGNALAFAPNSPYNVHFNKVIRHAQEYGLISGWKERIMTKEKGRIIHSSVEEVKSRRQKQRQYILYLHDQTKGSSEVLTLDHFQGAFYIWICLLGTSILLFMGEFFCTSNSLMLRLQVQTYHLT